MTRGSAGNLAPGTGRRSRVSSECETCYRSIEGCFEPEEMKCGDVINLNADARNIPDGTAVSFMIHDYRSDRMVDYATGQLQGSQVRHVTRESQKVDNQWHTPHLYFGIRN